MKNPTLQDKLNYANKVVAELIKEVQTVKQYAKKVEAQNEILREENTKIHSDYLKELEVGNKGISECYSKIDSQNYEISELSKELLDVRADYALLEEKYYTQDAVNTKLNAENYALKAEIERTNRHINLAENQLHREQQPLVVNHYHNCTINK
jgi:chromosome segregation ATPase